MLKNKRHELPEDRSINMTPMIDVVFQLILFFMLTSSLAQPRKIEVDLPRSSTAATPKEKDKQALLVSYRLQDGRPDLRVNGKPVEGLGRLAAAMHTVAAPTAQPHVDVQIDRMLRCQSLVSVLDAIRDAGYAEMSLDTVAYQRSTR